MPGHIFIAVNISATELFAALAHETRLRCLMLLLARDELCVCELTGAIGAPQPTMSRHLGQLRALGLVLDRRDGHWIHYRINPALPGWVSGVLQQTHEVVSSTAPFADDRRALAGMPRQREETQCA